MRFAHDTEPALRAAVVLVNSASDPDTMSSLEQLREFYRAEGYTGRPPRTNADLDGVRQARPRLRALLTAQRDEAADLVNEILADITTSPRLRRHDDLDWHLHIVDDNADLHVRILAETAMAVTDLIRADELSRLLVCAAEDCDGIVLDLTRNRSKIFCSPSCSNGTAVAAYRERQRKAAT
ncbi:CGNR zinc finger domain-containing protein [Calidifontibacter terrae]